MMYLEVAMAAMDLAQSTETPPAPSTGTSMLDIITPFINVGLVGTLVVMFVLRKGVVPEWVLKQTEERHAAEIAAKDADILELKKMVADGTKLYNEQVVPAFTRSIDVNREYLEVLRETGSAPRAAQRRTPRARGE